MIVIEDEILLSDTPFVAVDLERLDANIGRMAKLAREAKVKLRPHTKTHKSPFIAHLQLQAGAEGITVAKLGEAEAMADAGIDDILIAYPIVGRAKLERFGRLLQRVSLTVALDDIAVAEGINEVGKKLERRVPVYVDVDTGLQRMGRTPQASVSTVRQIAKLSHIEVRGLMSHTGHAYAKTLAQDIEAIAVRDAQMLYETRIALLAQGLDVREISVGATATARFIRNIPHATEMRPGMYVFNDRTVMGAGGATLDECAVAVVATVVARPENNRIIIDAGSKTLSNDRYGHGEGFGLIVGYPELRLDKLSEEHGAIAVSADCDLKIGDVVQIVPNHICPVINLADQLFGFREGRLERIIEVSARGKNR